MTRIDIDAIEARAKVGIEEMKARGGYPEMLCLVMFDIPAMAAEICALREELEAERLPPLAKRRGVCDCSVARAETFEEAAKIAEELGYDAFGAAIAAAIRRRGASP